MKSRKANAILRKAVVLATVLGISASVWADDPYVEFTGTQCVDTGYHVSGQTAIVADFQMTDTTTQQQFVWSAGTKLWHRFYVCSECTWSWSCLNWGTGDPAKEAKYDNSNTRQPVDGERTVATVDGFRSRVAIEKNGSILFEHLEDWADWAMYPHTETSSESLKIGCRFAENRFYAKMKLYSFKVYEAGELVRDYVPAEQDGIVGLYDQKNGGFVYDTRMPLGGDHLLSSGGELKKLNAAYIESVGDRDDVTCGMNARMRAYGDVRIEVDFALQKIVQQDRIFGANGRPCLYVNSEDKWTFSCGKEAKTMVVVNQTSDTNRHTVVVDYFTRKLELRNGPTVFWESEINSGFDPLESDTPMPFALFANMNSSSGSDGKGFLYRHQANARIYGARFYRAGKLVYDYCPCVKGGVAGFKDAVSGDFIFGENADAFTAGGDVERIGDDPYVQLTGNNANDGTKKWINTGYYPGPTSKIVLDYALADAYPGSGEWFLMSAYTPAAGDAAAERLNFEANKTSAVQWRNGTGTSFESVSDKLGTAATQRNVRRQICYDAEKGTCTLVTAGFTNVTATSAATLTRTMVDKTLRLGCNTDVVPVNFAPLKIYGLKIWEGDTLVHDFSPCVSNGVIGLRDVVSGRFAADSQATPKSLDAGGTISCDDWSRSAYLEFTGAQSFDTGIYPTSNTCVVADFQLTDLHDYPQQFVWSSDEFCHRLYTANGVWAWFCFNNNLGARYSGKAIDFGRFTATADPRSEHVEFVREGASWYKYGGSWESLTRTATSTSTLKIGSRFAEGTSGWCFTSMKLYRFKIYEKGDLVRDYVPYREDGVLGLFDLVHKDFITDSLKTAEMKMGGVGEVVTPLRDVTIAANAEETLVCRASGAVGYRWYVNGKQIEGATGPTCTIPWRSGLPKTDVISVVPQYELFGVPTEGVASTAEITYGSRGCVILFR